MAQRQPLAFGYKDWPAVPQAQEVSIETVVVIAFAVHDGQAQAGERKPALLPGAGKYVLGCALVETIKPVLIVGSVGLRWWVHYRPGVVFLPERTLQPWPDEIYLPGAEEHIAASAPGHRFHHGFCLGAVVKRGVDNQVKLSPA